MGNVRKQVLQSEILLFLSTVRYKVCVSTPLFEIVLVVCRSIQDLREVVLVMQAEQLWAAFLEQLYFMQWSRQFVAELNHTCYLLLSMNNFGKDVVSLSIS